MTPRFKRYAIYLVPDGPWGDFGARWLGWDLRRGEECQTNRPEHIPLGRAAHYGFHATIKPPFALAEGQSLQALQSETTELAQRHRRIETPISVLPLGRFLALGAQAQSNAMSELAADTVVALDRFRAPMSAAEFEKRAHPGLNDTQRAHLSRWGYAHVLDQFRFHLTLTGRMPRAQVAEAEGIIQTHLGALLDQPLPIDHLAVVGETDAGFVEISRHPLVRAGEVQGAAHSSP